MAERALLTNSCHVIPMRERAYFFGMRLALIPYLILRYKLRRLIPTDMEHSGDVVRKYIRDYEAEKVLKALGIEERDATAAVKVASYMHNLTNPLGEITELTPSMVPSIVRRLRSLWSIRFLTASGTVARSMVHRSALRALSQDWRRYLAPRRWFRRFLQLRVRILRSDLLHRYVLRRL